MLEAVCNHVHNFFELDELEGNYEIAGGTILLPFLLGGQRFKISGSALNDGVYTYHNGLIYDDDDANIVTLQDETFKGTITAMGVPRDFIRMVGDITTWYEKNSSVVESPYTSESFGGYSYTKASGGGGANGGLSWCDVFRSRLNAYRKVS